MKLTPKIIFIGILIVLLIWIFSAVIIDSIYDSSDRGTFGDMFGAVNALFSGLALFGIIVSILIQQKELNLQRLELSDTKEEFKVNRITNILFKQIDFLNSSIENINFYPYGEVRFVEKSLNINSFVPALNDLFSRDRQGEIALIINHNRILIYSIINEVSSIISSFESILDINELSEDEKKQMKIIFAGNLNPHFLLLLRYKILSKSNTFHISNEEEEKINSLISFIELKNNKC